MNSAVPTQASEKLTSAEFLRWSEDSRSSYVKIAGAMAGMIAVNNGQSAQRDCINRWYSGDQKQSNAYIADVMTDYPEAHPLAVLFAILENKCGSFDYRNQ